MVDIFGYPFFLYCLSSQSTKQTHLVGDCPEGELYLLATLHVLRLLRDHERHVLLQSDEPVPEHECISSETLFP